MDSYSMSTREDYSGPSPPSGEANRHPLSHPDDRPGGTTTCPTSTWSASSALTRLSKTSPTSARRSARFQLITQVAGRTGRAPKGVRSAVRRSTHSTTRSRWRPTTTSRASTQKDLEMRKTYGIRRRGRYIRSRPWLEQNRSASTRRRISSGKSERRSTSIQSHPRPRRAAALQAKGRTRMHLRLKCPQLEAVLPLCAASRRRCPNDKETISRIVLDVDPVSML